MRARRRKQSEICVRRALASGRSLAIEMRPKAGVAVRQRSDANEDGACPASLARDRQNEIDGRRMKKSETYKESWYLMDCSLPDLNWARLRVFESGRAEVFDCDG